MDLKRNHGRKEVAYKRSLVCLLHFFPRVDACSDHHIAHHIAEMARQNSLVTKLPYSPSLAPAINRATQSGISKGSRAAESPLKQVVPAKITSHFSQSQLALALAIQKAKPEALSTSGKSAMCPLRLPLLT
jgi:hypothetical protein